MSGTCTASLRLTGDRHRAEDLTQETFLRAWKRRAQLKDARAERVWLFRIAANIWKDELRQSRGRSALWSPLPEDAPDPEPTPEQCSESRESLERTLSLLNSLPVQQRTVLYLIAVEGLSAGRGGRCSGNQHERGEGQSQPGPQTHARANGKDGDQLRRPIGNDKHR